MALCLIDHIVQPDLAGRVIERHHRGGWSTAPSTTDHHWRHGRRQAYPVQGSKRGDHSPRRTGVEPAISGRVDDEECRHRIHPQVGEHAGITIPRDLVEPCGTHHIVETGSGRTASGATRRGEQVDTRVQTGRRDETSPMLRPETPPGRGTSGDCHHAGDDARSQPYVIHRGAGSPALPHPHPTE